MEEEVSAPSSSSSASSSSCTSTATLSAISEPSCHHNYGFPPSSDWSEASTIEQNFDSQATVEVQCMLEKLESFLYQENEYDGEDDLFPLHDECVEWSSLFPHIRVRGRQIQAWVDQGYEFISQTEAARCSSPYFFVSAPAAHGSAALSGTHTMQIGRKGGGGGGGLALGGKRMDPYYLCVKGNHVELSSMVRRNVSENNSSTTYSSIGIDDLENAFAWDDKRTKEALRNLRDCKERGSKSRWYQFRCVPVADEARSLTPTPNDPYSSRAAPNSSQLRCNVEIGANGIGGLDSCLQFFARRGKSQEGSAADEKSADGGTNSKDGTFSGELVDLESSFVLLMADHTQLRLLDELFGGITFSTVAQREQNQKHEKSHYGLIYLHWNSRAGADVDSSDRSDSSATLFEVINLSSTADVAEKEQHVAIKNFDIDAFDVASQWLDFGIPVFELHATSLSDLLKAFTVQPSTAAGTAASPAQHCRRLLDLGIEISCVLNVDDDVKPTDRLVADQTFAEDGEYEEWLAHDESDGQLFNDKSELSRRRRGLPPLTPTASIRSDVLQHLFEDVWSELLPIFQPFFDHFRSREYFGAEDKDKTIPQETSDFFVGDGDISIQERESLLSAMTIRPVPLQKRESSARVRTSNENVSAIIPDFTLRPDSARPTSGRISVRPGSARPMSARNIELYQQQHQSIALSRVQSSAVKAASWKRAANTNAGMRLSPLVSSQLLTGPAMTDVVQGTSIGIRAQGGWERPSTSVSSALAKRLPPIRLGSMPFQENVVESSVPAVATTLQTGKNVNRHVLFDTPEETPKSGRPLSPRPFSARRQPSGGIRGRSAVTTRPQTATVSSFDEPSSVITALMSSTASSVRAPSFANTTAIMSKNVAKSSASRAAEDISISLSPVLGTRFSTGRKKK